MAEAVGGISFHAGGWIGGQSEEVAGNRYKSLFFVRIQQESVNMFNARINAPLFMGPDTPETASPDSVAFSGLRRESPEACRRNVVGFSHLPTHSEIADGNFNLNLKARGYLYSLLSSICGPKRGRRVEWPAIGMIGDLLKARRPDGAAA
jgi:hypothetical protein